MTFENDQPPRKPRIFKLDDIADEPELEETVPGAGAVTSRRTALPATQRLTVGDINRGFRFGSILLSAMGALAALAAGLWFTRFVSVALEQRLRVAVLEREMRLAATEVDAAVERPRRIDEGELHRASAPPVRARPGQAWTTSCRESQSKRFATPSPSPVRGLQSSASETALTSLTYQR